MKQITLAELEACAVKYGEIKLARNKLWQRDVASLQLAIEHARGGKPVYVTNVVGKDNIGGSDYYILADTDIELPATVCANSLGRTE